MIREFFFSKRLKGHSEDFRKKRLIFVFLSLQQFSKTSPIVNQNEVSVVGL